MTDQNSLWEVERLALLKDHEILDTPRDGAFDRITTLAARFFDVPVALISLVDEDRIWFKSSHGLDLEEIPRTPGLCASVIYSDEAYVVKNAIEDPRTLSNPLVSGEFGLRFYAAAPLTTSSGHRLGTINVLDFRPREITLHEKQTLQDFAAIVVDQMELRLSARKIVEELAIKLLEDKEDQPSKSPEEFITICAWTKRIRVDGEWISFEEFLSNQLGKKVTHGIHPDLEL